MSATTVSTAVAQSKKPSLCITCRQNTVATPSGIVLPNPPRISVMGPPEGRPSGQHKRKSALPLLNSEFPPKPKSIFESSAPFVHPDHLHVYAQSDSPASKLPAPRWKPPVFRPRVPPDPTAPHYGSRGEILAALPDDVLRRLVRSGQDRIAESPSVLSGHTPADSVVISDSNMYAPDAQDPTAKPCKVSVTLTDGGAIKLKVPPKLSPSSAAAASDDATSSTAATQNAAIPIARKRKRMQPLAPAPVLNRVCFATGCGRPIPSHVEGHMCADCAFLRWRKQFRARVATLAHDEVDAKMTARREPTSSDSEEESLADALARKRAIRLLQQAFGPSLNPSSLLRQRQIQRRCQRWHHQRHSP
ncbi:hypothetical protein BD413DRAFT_197289 [Trametes elegans]|nr:hypothetical protein BD413DRAFT_197289 [Trametes elegans]